MELENIKDAAVYVGTYHKYNCGSIAGAWLKLADYESKADFYRACKELHKDEEDAEYMFQDWEYIPDGFIGESWISEKVWDFMELDDDDAEKVAHYINACSIDIEDYDDMSDLVREANEAYVGYYDDAEDYGQQCFDEFIAPFIDAHLRNTIEYHFNMREYGEEMLDDYLSDDNHYFDTSRI